MTEMSVGLRLYVGPDPLEIQQGRALLGAARRLADESMHMETSLVYTFSRRIESRWPSSPDRSGVPKVN